MEIKQAILDPSYRIENDCPEADMKQTMTVQSFLDNVRLAAYTDDDGFGHPATDGVENTSVRIYPSEMGRDIPEDATHIFWYNK